MWLGALLGPLLVVWHGGTIAEQMQNWEGTLRQTRLQFRPILQAHPTFPPDTLLYFLNPPMPSPYISGLMYLRYGRAVVARGVDLDGRANLRQHHAALIFYFDDAHQWREFSVAPSIAARVVPDLPAHFGERITRDGVELARDELARGESLVAIVYWRALARIETDYTIFAHLVDARGEIVASADTPPWQGDLPTSRWRVNEPIADGVIVHLEPNVPPGEYRLLIGLYDLATMQRLSIVDARGQPFADKVVLAPIWIIE